MDFNIKKLPKVRISNPEALPPTSGLFFAIDNAARVWYVGTAKNLRESLKAEKIYSTFTFDTISWIAYFSWEDWDDLTDWEIDCLSKFNPPMNTSEDKCPLPIANLGYSQTQYLNRYKEIQDMIRLLEQEKDDLKPSIVSLIEVSDGVIATDSFTARISTRRSYTYSSQLEAMRRDVVSRQKDEEQSGVAQVKSESVFPVIKENRRI
jgi:hypothetical protein